MTDIPVFRQDWKGWPEGCNDELSLIQIGLESGTELRVNSVRRHDRQNSGVIKQNNLVREAFKNSMELSIL